MYKDAGVIRKILAWSMVGVLWPAFAVAQSAPDAPDPETVHVRVGPFWIRPTLALTDVGIDTNVFNVAESDSPESDFTMTFTPAARVWMGLGSTWISGDVTEGLVWYKEFSSERSANTSFNLGWFVPLSRMTLTASGKWTRTRERPGYEIDERADRSERGFGGTVELRILSKTFIGVRADRRSVDFDEGEVFLDTNLHDELNRTQTMGSVTLRHELTPLTSLTFDASRIQDRFDFSSLRDADSTQVSAGVAFTPDALISGSAKVGYRDFNPIDSSLPEFRGSIAAVNLSYVAGDTTKFAFQGGRDVQFSFDVDQPYYLLTGITLSVTQQLFGPVDVEGRLTRQRLSYREREGASVEVADRVDRVRILGAGVGYRLREDLRMGFNVDHQKRDSEVESRSYSGMRYGGSVTYGF